MKEQITEYIQDLQSVNLEITSLCNMSKEHCTQCPNAWRMENFGQTNIKTEVIERFFKELNGYGYTGLTAFHSYNEPLMDKRIYDICATHKELCPDAKIEILSNGRLMDNDVAVRLLKLGVDQIAISAYEDSTYQRLVDIFAPLRHEHPNCKFFVTRQILDDRMHMYGWKTRAEKGLPTIQTCNRVKEQLVVTATGELQVCCYEWKKEMQFGNIKENTLTEILEKSDFLSIRDDLIKGYRDNYHPCDRCTG